MWALLDALRSRNRFAKRRLRVGGDSSTIEWEMTMADGLQGVRVAFVVANEGVEEVELTKPWAAVRSAGGTPVLVAPKPGVVQTMNHLDQSATYQVDLTTSEARAGDFDALVLPGGVANPDQLRLDDAAVGFVGDAFPRREAHCRHLSRPMDPGGGRPGPGSLAHVLAQSADRHRERRRDMG